MELTLHNRTNTFGGTLFNIKVSLIQYLKSRVWDSEAFEKEKYIPESNFLKPYKHNTKFHCKGELE